MLARCVMLYWPQGAEVDVRPIFLRALKLGKLAALPRITGPGTMEARASDPGELVPGFMGIPEPPESAQSVPPEKPDLIIVPGAAFTRDGRRLGRGGGYYDRFLPLTRGLKLALVRPEALFDDLPTEVHDVRVDEVITI